MIRIRNFYISVNPLRKVKRWCELKRIEKIEVKKSSGVYYYTGEVSEHDKDNIIIKTTRGETFIFRKDQVEGRTVMKGDELNGKSD